MDWNIFFSTISQTSGAIVGIFSAFLITKIVSNQSAYGHKLNLTSDSLSESKKLSNESTIRSFQWYGKRRQEDALRKLRADFDDTGKLKSPEEYYEELYFSPFESKAKTLETIQNEIDTINEEEQAERERVIEQRHALGAVLPRAMKMPHIPNLDLIHKLNEERELIDNLYVRIQYRSDINRNLLSDLNSGAESSTLISISIFAVVLLFFAGVIYPLSFLPLKPGVEITLTLSAFWDILFSLKGLLLALISSIFGSLMVAFYFVNRKLSYSEEIKAELEKFSTAKSYSVYFENYEKNQGT
ncbi:hypothetical protein L1D54_20555 [Vibrio brasiliensis]|uniref:hypothetical protein n=1 Tax=Vibrio brasiliensis TaxID=170652 RepID=UPI001EFE4600|nr:hypothetical protein [Vibrio brasiliensis]MCG9752833.1 hypothetical protein [Vibrio brasiliensis]